MGKFAKKLPVLLALLAGFHVERAFGGRNSAYKRGVVLSGNNDLGPGGPHADRDIIIAGSPQDAPNQDQAFVVTGGYKVSDGVLDGSFGGVTHVPGGVKYGYEHEGPHSPHHETGAAEPYQLEFKENDEQGFGPSFGKPLSFDGNDLGSGQVHQGGPHDDRSHYGHVISHEHSHPHHGHKPFFSDLHRLQGHHGHKLVPNFHHRRPKVVHSHAPHHAPPHHHHHAHQPHHHDPHFPHHHHSHHAPSHHHQGGPGPEYGYEYIQHFGPKHQEYSHEPHQGPRHVHSQLHHGGPPQHHHPGHDHGHGHGHGHAPKHHGHHGPNHFPQHSHSPPFVGFRGYGNYGPAYNVGVNQVEHGHPHGPYHTGHSGYGYFG